MGIGPGYVQDGGMNGGASIRDDHGGSADVSEQVRSHPDSPDQCVLCRVAHQLHIRPLGTFLQARLSHLERCPLGLQLIFQQLDRPLLRGNLQLGLQGMSRWRGR